MTAEGVLEEIFAGVAKPSPKKELAEVWYDKKKVWYMILVLITVYLEIMYDSTWMLAMLAFELLLAKQLCF